MSALLSPPAVDESSGPPQPAGKPLRTEASRYVAVAGFEQAPGADRPAECQSLDRRLHASARKAVAAALPAMSAVAAGAAGMTLAWLAAIEVGRLLAAVALLTALALAAMARLVSASNGRRQQSQAAVVLAAALVLSAQPWLAWPSSSFAGWIAAPALGALAIAGAALLAPLPRWAALAVLLPLPLALRAAGPAWTGDAVSAFAFASGLFCCATAAAIAVALHQAWRRSACSSIDRDDRIDALTAERDTATRADHDKSRFLAIASHDLRQPVHALGLFAATLEKRLQGTHDEPLVNNMIRSIDGLDRSFNAMLDVSRLDAGTVEPNIQHFPLRDLFRRLHMHFAGQAELRDLGLRFWPGGKSVSSDPQLLERVLGNLVQNALKYTATGGVVVVARTTGTHTNVEVWDTGVGIPPALLPRVFDEFYQVGRSEHARTQGLGIGLAIVERLCRLLGHRLSVASVAGRGTMFRIGIAHGALAGIEAATAPADTRPMPLSQPRTVLIIDDEQDIREGLRLLLDEWGYDAVTAGSVAEAQQVVAASALPPDLILSDLHLGDGPDGIAAVATLRKQLGCDVSAVLITGDTSHDEMRRVADSGHPVLYKPVQPRKLYNVVRGLLE